MEIKSIIVDDEAMARHLLKGMIEEYCPEIQILAVCENLPDAIKAIKKHQPQLVFLDIEMPGYSGLEILDFFNEEEMNFSIIFTTAYNQFAIQAFKLSAIDYLLIPIESEELKEAVKRFSKIANANKINGLREMMETRNLKKIAIQYNQTIKFANLDEILFLKGDGSYTYVYLKDGSELMSSKNLKVFEDILCKQKSSFFRSHKSSIINLNYVTSISKVEGNYVLINHEHKVALSAEKTNLLLRLLEE